MAHLCVAQASRRSSKTYVYNVAVRSESMTSAVPIPNRPDRDILYFRRLNSRIPDSKLLLAPSHYIYARCYQNKTEETMSCARLLIVCV